MIRSGAVTMIAVALATSGSTADWPGYRGPKRDAHSMEEGLLAEWPNSGPPLAWKAQGLGAGFSSVAVVGDGIYTMGDKDGAQQVIALSRADGKIRWTTKVGPPHDDEYGGPRATPTVDGDALYAMGTDGDLVCLETATGKERWRKSLVRDFGGSVMSGWKFSESPLVDRDRVLVTPGSADAAMVALDKKTGATIWKSAIPNIGAQGRDGAGYSSIVISTGAGTKQYVQLLGRGLVGIRASDGKYLWGYNRVANRVANIATPIVRASFVFASTGYQTGAALLELYKDGEGVSAREIYFLDSQTFQNHHGGMVLAGNHLYAGHGHKLGLPICIDFVSGKVAWGGKTRNAGQGSATVLYADGRIYYRYENGTVLLIEATPEGYREKGTFTIPNVTRPSWANLALSEGLLYVREQDTLYAYDVRITR
jgi:outer membrane protein assembly factor BamB